MTTTPHTHDLAPKPADPARGVSGEAGAGVSHPSGNAPGKRYSITAGNKPVRQEPDGLDEARLENVKHHGSKTIAACPACREAGSDTAGDNLSIDNQGKFTCIKFTGAEGTEHRKRIYELAGKTKPATDTTTGTTERKGGKAHATLDDAARAACWSVGQQSGGTWKETHRPIYRNEQGESVLTVIRFDNSDGTKKQYRPIHKNRNGWKMRDPRGKLPVYNLPEIIQADVVHFCEGEKTSDAGQLIGLTCTTTAHGAQSPQKSDFTPLDGKHIRILPDNDEAGRSYADKVAALATAAGAASVKIVELPGLPEKGDLVDFIEASTGTPDAIRAEIELLAHNAPLWIMQQAPEVTQAEPDSELDPIQAAKAGTPYAMTDLGNAERFRANHGDSVRWDVARKCWRVWDGKRWAIDSALRVNALAAATARAIRKEASVAPVTTDGNDLGLQIFRWGVKSESREKISAMIEVAKALEGIAIAATDLDTDPMLLNVNNGTLDLKTGTLRKHSPSDLLTKLSPVDFVPGYRCQRWEKFLDDCTEGDKSLQRFLQAFAGYCLTGLTIEEKMPIIHGAENSGKTTLLESIHTAMGDYAATIKTELITKSKNTANAGAATPEVASLVGVRMAGGSEIEDGKEIAAALTKQLTGGERIPARHLYGNMFTFIPQFKLVLTCNHLPKAPADDGGLWRRIIRISFNNTIPREKRDLTLKRYLQNHATGARAVLAWAVEGCLIWQRDGLVIPESVQRTTDAYRNDCDPLATFFEDCLIFHPHAWTSASEILAAYHEHATEQGTQERFRVSPRRLGDRLKDHGCTNSRRHLRGWLGVMLKDETESPRVGCVASATNFKTFPRESVSEKVLKNTTQATQAAQAPKTTPKTPEDAELFDLAQ